MVEFENNFQKVIAEKEIYQRSVGWQDFYNKVDVQLIDITDESISYKITPYSGCEDIDILIPEFSSYCSDGNYMKERLTGDLIEKLYIPVFEIPEFREIYHPDWHAPILKTLQTSIPQSTFDFDSRKISCFVVTYKFMVEDVSKGYDYW